jgi:hypothetical protein
MNSFSSPDVPTATKMGGLCLTFWHCDLINLLREKASLNAPEMVKRKGNNSVRKST